jgi:hypothetical protein
MSKNQSQRSGGDGGKGQDKNRNRRRKGSKKKKADPRVFWGDPQALADIGSPTATITTKPSAVIQSLGRAPLSNQANASEHYFAAVYDRAVNLAAALAAAGDLTGDPDDEQPA